MSLALRCADVDTALESVATLFSVEPRRLARALPSAAARAHADPDDPVDALLAAVATELGTAMSPPATIHYFHGTRTSSPASFVAHGIRPLCVVLDALWEGLGALMEELAATDLKRLRRDLTAGDLEPHTYPLRVGGAMHHGPCGHLVRDALVHPREYHSVDYFAGSEIAVDICEAVRARFGLDAVARYRQATRPAIVEFALTAAHVDGAVASALWYLEAALRGERTWMANWGHDGCGTAVPAAAIVSVTEPVL